MKYIGLLVDDSVVYELFDGDIGFYSYWLHMQERIRKLRSWPGQEISDRLSCDVCYNFLEEGNYVSSQRFW